MIKRELSDEQLADDHVRRHHNLGFGRNALGLLILTLFAFVVIIPFIYMLMISLKSQSELGDGRFVPKEIRRLGDIRKHEFAWVRLVFNEEQTAALNTMTTVPVSIKESSSYVLEKTVPALPPGVVGAEVLSLEKPSLESDAIIAILEAPNPDQAIDGMSEVTVFLPTKEAGQWEPFAARVLKRSFSTVMARMVSNYRSLLKWEQLSSGRLLDWLSQGYPRWYFNSLFVAFCTVILGLFFDSLAGFAFAKFRFPFRRLLFGLLLATIMIPYPVTLVPTFFIFAKMGFYNTFAALIVPGIVSAFGIFLVKQYVQTIPDDMLDAARVDGAGDFMVYRYVILPIARPVLAALAVFRFIYQWNGYLYPLVLTNRDSMKTVQLGLATMEDVHGSVHYGVQMAGAALAVVPILVVYAFMQKHFISGITLGSVKD